MSKYKVGDKVVMKIISADQDEIKTYSVSGVNNDWRWCLPQNLLERYICQKSYRSMEQKGR